MIAVYMTGAATILLLAVPFIPGLRDIPRWIPVHRLIWRGGGEDAGLPTGGPQADPGSSGSAGPAGNGQQGAQPADSRR
jgi:hypothetical protein